MTVRIVGDIILKSAVLLCRQLHDEVEVGAWGHAQGQVVVYCCVVADPNNVRHVDLQ